MVFCHELIKVHLFEKNVNCTIHQSKLVSKNTPAWIAKLCKLALLAAFALALQMPPVAGGHVLREKRSLPFPPIPPIPGFGENVEIESAAGESHLKERERKKSEKDRELNLSFSRKCLQNQCGRHDH